jgi:hypothetical protein
VNLNAAHFLFQLCPCKFGEVPEVMRLS